MPRVVYPQTNFTGGEITPKLRGRVDIPPVQNGAETLANVLCVAQGGAMRRWGLQFVAESKVSANRSRLIPFIFNSEQAYMIEAGDGYARFYDQDGGQIESGGLPYELVLPFNEEQILAADYTQGGDTMFLLNVSVYPQRLRRITDNQWSINDTPFITEPFAEIGIKPAAALTLSSAAVGSRTFTAGAAVFLETDVGRYILSGGGAGEITGYTSTTVVTVNVLQAFDSTSIASGDWTLDGSPIAYCQPSGTGPIGESITLTISDNAGGSPATITAISRVGEEVTVETAAAHGFSLSMSVVISGCNPPEYNGTYAIDSMPSSTSFTYTTLASPGVGTGFGLAMPLIFSTTPGWRTDDVGKYVRINGGVARITGHVSTSVVDAEVLQEMISAVPAPAMAWSIEASLWDAERGYPRTGTIYEQRLWLAGSLSNPLTVWGSVLAEYLDFLTGPLATDAVSYLASTDRFDPILQLTHCKCLVALTAGADFTFGAGSETAIGPTNPPKVTEQSNWGSASIAPERVGGELMKVQAGNQRLRAMSPDQYDARNYGDFDLSALAEHLYRVGITQISYQRTPEPVLWHVLEDGRMAALSIDREQSLIATTQILTDGFFEDVATFPGTGGEQTWAIVRRTVDGQTVRYIERFTPGRQTDACITGTSGPGSATWDGLDHLEGCEVDCVADGVDMGTFTVEGGEITLPRIAYEVEIGLNYVSTVKTLTPEIGTSTGSSQGASCRINLTTIRLFETIGGKLEGTELQARKLGLAAHDTALQPFSGDVYETGLGWNKGVAQLTITQDRPLPFHVLGVFYKITVNEG